MAVVKKGGVFKTSLNIELTFLERKVSLTGKINLARNLAAMMRSGIPVGEALSISEEVAEGRLKRILHDVARSVQSGNSLSSSLTKYPKDFSGLFLSAARIGETSGTLEENLVKVADQIENEKELRAKIKGAMIYPLFILAAAAILGVVMAFVVLPKITPLFENLNVELPVTTRILIAVSNFIQENGILAGTLVVVTVIGVTWLLRQTFVKPAVHLIFLKMPVINKISRNANIARFTRSLGTLLKSGAEIEEALDITKDVLNNYYYRKAVAEIGGRIGKGTRLSSNLDQYPKLFPIMVTRMIRVGEESGSVADSLLQLARYHELEVDHAAKNLSTAIEPVLLLVIGVFVGFIALSLISPLYEITGSIGA